MSRRTYESRIGENKLKVQIKGTSKNMCKPNEEKIGVEMMGTHGQFPKRGYKSSSLDYLAIIISDFQLSKYRIKNGFHFVFIPVKDLPKHYLINNGKEYISSGWGNKKWNEKEFSDILYPNVKFKTRLKLLLLHFFVFLSINNFIGYNIL